MISLEELDSLVGMRFPEGRFTLDADRNDAFTSAAQTHESGVTLPSGLAHPLFAHLATHCGMGLTIEEFFETAGAPMDSGALFGEGVLTYDRPIEVGKTYRVVGGIAEARRKEGAQTGTFDAITVSLELLDGQDRVCASQETYIFPRKEATS